MPCDDITEQIRIVLDRNERLKSYRLFKKTCGDAIGGESRLLDRLKGLSIDDLLHLDMFTLHQPHADDDRIEKFLSLKHIFAVRATLVSFTGRGSAGIGDTCTIAGIDYDGDDTIIDAEINIGLITDQIEACAPP